MTNIAFPRFGVFKEWLRPESPEIIRSKSQFAKRTNDGRMAERQLSNNGRTTDLVENVRHWHGNLAEHWADGNSPEPSGNKKAIQDG
ncbi:MAG TPA: hypothetical protein VJ783_07290 [Pirellulales bacterium]|nr:hypothetical protein [Pirellulales bacterium]